MKRGATGSLSLFLLHPCSKGRKKKGRRKGYQHVALYRAAVERSYSCVGWASLSEVW